MTISTTPDSPHASQSQVAIRHLPVAFRHLPVAFSDLTPFVAEWALRTERERYLKLHSVTLEHLRVFYDAMLPRMDEVLTYLNQWEVQNLPPDARTLFDLTMTFSETAHPLDLNWKHVDFTNAYPWQGFEFRTVSREP